MSKTSIKKYQAAIGKGFGDMDFSAVHEAQDSSLINVDNLKQISDSFEY